MMPSWPHRSIGQKGSAGVRKAVGYNMSSFANSPVNGLLYMTGSLGAPPMHRLPALHPPHVQCSSKSGSPHCKGHGQASVCACTLLHCRRMS